MKGNTKMKKMLAAVAAVCVMGGFAASQTVDEIIAKSLEARGGKDKILAVKSIRAFGKVFAGGMEIPMGFYWKRPSKIRYESTFGGKTSIQAFDGKAGWYIGMMGPGDAEKMPDEMIKEMDDAADMDGNLVDYKTKGHTVELVGTEDLDGAKAHKLKVTLKSGNVKYVFIDAETWLEVKNVSKSMQQGAEVEVETYFSNYATIDGLVMSLAFESKMGGQTVSQIGIDSLKFNVDVNDSLFAMPAPKKVDSTKATEKK
jgi:outer membrane lipoprotein-sorting protein